MNYYQSFFSGFQYLKGFYLEHEKIKLFIRYRVQFFYIKNPFI